ncbi:Metallo-beta-lactamase superfamily protein [Granulicella pectinivorans]|uniref:Metallo-beta-lactamase superfamily protein n=1 Tax=Granulicella pectinivorans TaxID=474950 RepID=A0A1I6MP14_9BACT|nr:MBL fold metallo-hydrolase [Granulicella pectinivorans]SFS17384.1 Metallo-beta-lactamase superfamily protein [Granulicella pectinivorans]
MKSILLTLALGLLTLPAVFTFPAVAQSGELKISFIDVEGGQSTLFVTPTGQSLLIDTGWAGHESRDADRIVAAAKAAHLSRIDYVLITHYHADHVGGVPQLAARFPIGTFLVHGPNREPGDKSTVEGYTAYQALLAGGKQKQLVLHPGDKLPITGIDAMVISSDGETIAHALPGAGKPNAFCGVSETRPADVTENARSLGILIRFGKLKILDLGDLTWDKEMQMMCPNDKLGHIDIDIVSHHGWYQSSSPALVHAIAPRVAIMDNGAKKGGSTPVLKVYQTSPGLEALWQLHYSEEGGPENNTADKYVANPQGTDAGVGLELIAHPNGAFEITNDRTHATETYPAK